ncbi:MAG: DUF1592 domain-containing protein [Kofleriaceae bacterium]|nr:DUF1592 domain-containing protein [Kofleriaceae bacterium]
MLQGRDRRPRSPAASPYDVASRLSYLLWSTMPDDELFAAAASSSLATPAQVEAQVDRMLADPRALDGFRRCSPRSGSISPASTGSASCPPTA